MAFAKSILLSQIRGSIGDLTFFSVPGRSMVIRERVIPVDPATAHQLLVRGAFTTASSNWSNFSESARLEWDLYASMIVPGRSIGRRKLTGRSAFFKPKVFTLYLRQLVAGVNLAGNSPPDSPGATGLIVSNNIPLDPVIYRTGFTVSNPNSFDIQLFYNRKANVSSTINFFVGPWAGNKWSFLEILAGASHDFLFVVPAGQVDFFKVRATQRSGAMSLSPEFIQRSVGSVL